MESYPVSDSMLLKTGNGNVSSENQHHKLILKPTQGKRYHNSQIDDYHNLKRKDFKWSAPLKLSLMAKVNHHSSSELKGTVGFGFWNDPFLMTGLRPPTLPKALWFFYSSAPSFLYMNEKSSGPGWKAMTVDAYNAQFLSVLPLLSIGFPLFNIKPLKNYLWPLVQKSFKGSEQNVDHNFLEWHAYTIHWEKSSVSFYINNQCVHKTPFSPSGKMGLVIWIDNQYLILKPTGRLGWGNIHLEHEQSLEIKNLKIET